MNYTEVVYADKKNAVFLYRTKEIRMEKRKQMKSFYKIKRIICMTLAILLCAGAFWGFGSSSVKAEGSWPSGISVGSESAIVMEAKTGTILYEKNIHTKRYPASITKIMTTMLALEHCELDEIVTYSEDAVYKTEGSGIYRNVGEQMTLEDTLYAVMLESANECAYATAEHVTGGDYEAFIKMMNDKATELGCLNTNFTNSNGLPDEQHVTTCYDMALISREAIKDDMFRTLVSTRRYDLPATNKSLPLAMFNHHKMISNNITAQYLYEYAIGGKTGYTNAARSTLVTYAEKDGMLLVCVVMKSEGTHFTDTINLFDYCFDNFKVLNVAENETRYSSDAQESATMMTQNEAFAQLDEDAVIVLPKDADFMDTITEVSYEGGEEGAMGSLVYHYGDRQVGRADVVVTGAQVDTYDFAAGTEEDVDTSEITIIGASDEEESRPVVVIVLIAVIVVLAIFVLGVVRYKMRSRYWRSIRHPDRQYVKIKNRKRRRRRHRGRW